MHEASIIYPLVRESHIEPFNAVYNGIVAFLGDQAYQKNDHSSNAEAKGCKDDEEIPKGVQYPNALHLLAGGVEYGLLAQLERVKQHPIKIPAQTSKYAIKRDTGFITLIPAAPFIFNAILQLFQKL